jgi:hypothetical protein
VGSTDREGRLIGILSGTEGATVSTTVACPPTFSPPREPNVLHLVHAQDVKSGKTQALHVEFVCSRNERQLVVVVRAQGGPGLGLFVADKSVGATDADGLAHVLVNVDRTVKKITVGLDTTANPYIRPKNPSRVYELSGTDAILLFDQNFTQGPRPMRPRNIRPSTKHIPYRVD